MYQLNKFSKIKKLVYGFSNKKDGNMSFNWGSKESVLANRKKFLQRLNIPIEYCIGMSLEHKTKIEIVDNKSFGKGILNKNGLIADALVTQQKNIFLFLLIGDCLPTIIYDFNKKIICLAHMSILNSQMNFAKKIINFLKNKFNSNPKDMIVGIGPAIHQKSYIKNNFKPKNSGWKNYLSKIDNKIAIDLINYNKDELINCGVLEKNIEISSIDTAKSPDFFSHFRAKRSKEKEGRFATVFGML